MRRVISFEFPGRRHKSIRHEPSSALPALANRGADESVVSAMPPTTVVQDWLHGMAQALRETPLEERSAVLKRIEAVCEASQDLRKLEAIREWRRQNEDLLPPSTV